MLRPLTKTDKLALEDIIDRSNVQSVLDAIATICAEKADHLATNWQEPVMARVWTKAAEQIDRVSTTNAIEEISF